MSEESGKDKQDLFSKPVKAGKRTYFFDVKSTKGGTLYLTITESKKRMDHEGKFYYEKHKIFLYREDFEKFLNGFQEASRFVIENSPEQVEESGENEVNFEDL